MRGVGAVLVLLMATGACRGPRVSDPLPSVERYLSLAAEGQTDAAYAMLSEDFRRGCDRPCFARLSTAQREEIFSARTALRAGQARVEMQAQVELSDGSHLRLIQPAAPGSQAAGPYLFSENPLDFYPQDTPERALRSFMRAVEARRYAVVVRFLPQSLEEQYTLEALQKRFEGSERAALLEKFAVLRRHLSEPFELEKEGHVARLPVGEGKAARLILEDGRWRVVQVD